MDATSQIGAMFAGCEADAKTHRKTQDAFLEMTGFAMCSISDIDAGQLLLKTLGSEEAVQAWCENTMKTTNATLMRWRLAARMEKIETNKQKGITE